MDSLDALFALERFGIRPGLDTIRLLVRAMGDPQSSYRTVIVAGTNGKGSVVAMADTALRAAGHRVGRYTSPHLQVLAERFVVDGAAIPERELRREAARLHKQVDRLRADGRLQHQPTFFEATTAIALSWFRRAGVHLALLEVGLGGRLDATNIVTPLASVITNIGLDHTRWLGETHATIAAEKAGIIKPGIPALTAAAQPEALAVIRAEAARQGAELIELGQAESTADLPLLGRHQQTNASLAKAVVGRLQGELPVPPGAIRAGLAKVHWPGRLQVIRRGEQTVLLDGAHNAEGAAMLRQALADGFSADSPVFILGMVDEKDGAGFCAELATLAKRIVLSPVSSARSAKPDGFVVACQAANPAAAIEVAESLGQALEWCAAEPFVVVAGSFYLVGEAMERLGVAPTPSEAERQLNDWGAPGRRAKTLSD